LSTAFAVALQEPAAAAVSGPVWASEVSVGPALDDTPLLGLVAAASAGIGAEPVMLVETIAFLRACDLGGLRRALLAMEFSTDIAELEMANPGI